MSLSAQEAQKFAQVVTFTNVSDQSFIHTHCFGDTEPITYRFEPGEKRVLPLIIASFLAKHLARKILIGSANGMDPKDRRKIFGDEDEAKLIAKILSDQSTAEAPRVKTVSEEIQEHIKNLNPEDTKIVTPDESGNVETKSEIIEKLKERGDKVDFRKSKAELKQQLTSADLPASISK